MKAPHIDLAGKTIMITGASGGIGKVAAMRLAEMGAYLVLVCRNRNRGEAAIADIVKITGNQNIQLMLADLRFQSQVRAVADAFLAQGRPLHVLLNNAGLIIRNRIETVDGLETTFAVNYLSHYLLTRLLLPCLINSAPARIVNVASEVHRHAGGRLNFDNLNGEQRYHPFRIYCQSKLANILFTHELAHQLKDTGVTVNAAHPGPVATNFARDIGGFAQFLMTVMRPLMRTPNKGAQTSVYLCASPEVNEVTGKCFFKGKQKDPSEAANNIDDAHQLWDVSARMTGLESGVADVTNIRRKKEITTITAESETGY